MYWLIVWPIAAIVIGAIVITVDDDCEWGCSDSMIGAGLIGLSFGTASCFILMLVTSTVISHNKDWDRLIKEEKLKPHITTYKISSERAIELAKGDIEGSVQVDIKVDDNTTRRSEVRIRKTIFVVKSDTECPRIEQRVYSHYHPWTIATTDHIRTYIYVPTVNPKE